MNPELFQSFALSAYSLVFLLIGFIVWKKKTERLQALKNNFPHSNYFKMRLETSRIFEAKDHLISTFGGLTFDIR